MFPQKAVQAVRLLALRRGKRTVSLSSPEPECSGLLLLYQRLHHHKYVPEKETHTHTDVQTRTAPTIVNQCGLKFDVYIMQSSYKTASIMSFDTDLMLHYSFIAGQS